MREIKLIQDEHPDDLAIQACEAFFEVLKEQLSKQKEVVVSLCGGTSITKFYETIPDFINLIEPEEWKRVHWFFTDERLVPPDDQESNYLLAMNLLLRQLVDDGVILEENIHRYRGEDDPKEATKAYDEELAIFGGKIHVPVLGVGPDSHIGALFPEHDALNDDSGFLFLEDSPKPPPRRETLSPRHVRESEVPILFFVGEKKREAYENFMNKGDFHKAPCRLAREGEGTVIVVTDLK